MVPQARLVTCTPFAGPVVPPGNQADETIKISAWVAPVDLSPVLASIHKCFQRRISAILAIDANQIAQRRDTRPELLDTIFEVAVIKKPGHLGIIHVLHIGVDGVAIVDRNPNRAGAHDSQHATPNPGIDLREDSCTLFTAEPVCPHGTSNAFSDGARLSIGTTYFAIDEGSAVRTRLRTFIKIVNRSHTGGPEKRF